MRVLGDLGAEPGLAVVQRHESDGSRAWWCFREPDSTLRVHSIGEVAGVLAEVQSQTLAGKIAVGFLSYEAASGLDPKLETLAAGSLPVAYFAIYGSGVRVEDPGSLASAGPLPQLDWTATMDAASHGRAIHRIHGWISQGETYQVNLTYRLRSPFREPSWPFFCRLVAAQGAGHSAYLDLGDHVLASVSPELFFRLEGTALVTRPMKGTAARGRTRAEDEVQVEKLRTSAKECAENLMIVDMLRNDLGKIARPGSVRVEKLYEVERYSSVLQMTSTVTAESGAGLTDILPALFPSASITGAPKIRAMQLIAEIEGQPRGIYTGAIGVIGPGRSAEMNVAIRTLHVDRVRAIAEYGTGGGIVWDSDADSEHRETLTKALVLTHNELPPTLLETLGWFPGEGYRLLDRHLQRLLDSAAYYGISVRGEDLISQLERRAESFADGAWKVRVLVGRGKGLVIEAAPLLEAVEPWVVGMAESPVDSRNALLFHKTTRREIYEKALAAVPGVQDVVLWNAEGMATEFSVGNLVVEANGRKITPPLSCGLLAGTMRAELLDRGEIEEGVVWAQEVREILSGEKTGKIWLVNSVRGWIEAVGLSASLQERKLPR